MGRIRTIKPEFWTDEEIAGLSEAAQLLALALLNYADDEGYFNANPALIKASCFPLREPSVSLQGMLSELSMIGFAGIGKTSDGKSYGHIANFAKHQRINRPTPSKIKTLTIAWDDSERIHGGLTKPSMNTHGVLTEPSPQEGKGKEGKGETRPQIPEPPQDGPILDDAHPLQMANHIIETLGLPWHRQLQIQLAECIKAKAKNAGIG